MKAIVFNDTSTDDHHGCQIVMQQFMCFSEHVGIKIISRVPMELDWEADAGIKKKLANVNLCIINGEGTMHDDAPAALKLGRLAEYCFNHQIPCFLINTVWQKNKVLNQYAKYFNAIYVRDSFSSNELKAIGVHAKVVPDLTLTIDSPLGAVRSGLIINGSVIPDVLVSAWKTKNEAVYDDISYVSIRTIPPIHLSFKHPRRAIRSLKKRFKQCRHIVKSYLVKYPSSLSGKGYSLLRWRFSIVSTSRFIKRVRRSEGVLTGRFHLVTLCLVTKTPFYAVSSNTFKIEGLLSDVGLTGRVFDSYSKALRRRASIDFTDEELKKIEVYIEEARDSALEMFQEIKRLTTVYD